jgi:hypothetical protein
MLKKYRCPLCNGTGKSPEGRSWKLGGVLLLLGKDGHVQLNQCATCFGWGEIEVIE